MKSWYLILLLFACNSAACQRITRKPLPGSHDTGYVYTAPSRDGTGKVYMGREIAQVMDASGSDWLERPQRPAEENSELAIDNFQLQSNSVVADIGAGTGYYTFKIASRIPKGKVYAVEIQPEYIKILNEKITRNAVGNVEVIQGDTASPNLPDTAIDLAVMVDVYHELMYPREVLASIKKSLKKNGKLVLMEYRGEDPAVRIKPLHKLTVSQVTREMKANGFVLDRRVDVLPIQHLLVFRKEK